jgi:NAD+ kinase
MNKFFLVENDHNRKRNTEMYSVIEKNLNLVNDANDADYILVCGGDGSLLESIHEFHKYNKPFVGINGGTLGYYMHNVEGNSMEEDIIKFNKCNFELLELPMLKFKASNDKQIFESVCFADIWIKADRNSMIYNICVSDGIVKNYCSNPDFKIYGDGILFSTPVGSTGYTHNLGGSIYPFNVDIFQVVPMASSVNKKTLKAFPLSMDSKVEVFFHNTEFRTGKLFYDGFCVNDLEEYKDFIPNQVLVEKSEKIISLGFINLNDFRVKSFNWLL